MIMGQMRIIYFNGSVDEVNSLLAIVQLLNYNAESKTEPIYMYINSPGGSVPHGLAIYDTMQFLNCDIVTYCVGQAASMATVLLAAGTRGKRYALPHSRVMIHQPSGGVTGQASDISIAAKEILRWRSTINAILAEHSSKSVEQIEKDSDRDFFLSAEEAKTYGLVDHVIVNNPQKSL